MNAKIHFTEPADDTLPTLAVLCSDPRGWFVQMQDASGKHILNSAVYPSKFLAEEALSLIIARTSK